jgi:CRP/FNR family transcriptional regulator, cyclic AMP receptor protein
MRKALYILGELNDNDVEWLAHSGGVRRLRDGEVIIREGEPLDTLFITLEGKLRVIVAEGREVARLGAGEVVGEIAFVEASPPSATVSAIGNAVVLALEKPAVQQHLVEDPAFAARFYRALAIFLADRLRATTRRLGYGDVGDLESEASLQDELDPLVLDTISQAGDRFTRLLRKLTAR